LSYWAHIASRYVLDISGLKTPVKAMFSRLIPRPISSLRANVPGREAENPPRSSVEVDHG
jgi:hypothetical protein